MLSAVTPYDRVREALEAAGHPVRNGSARCPAHDDKSPSLSLSEGGEGKVVVHCHAGCATDAVLAALNLTLADLFPPSTNGNGRGEPVARYPYTDETGKLLYTVLRFNPKSFAQIPANGRKGRGAMDGVRLVLYRLPKVIEAAGRGDIVYIVEGEKDVEALERAGKVATCNPAGAGKWGKVADAVHYLRGAQCVIVADKDETGLAHARTVASSLTGAAANYWIVEAESGKDAADHLAAGYGPDDFPIVAGDGGPLSMAEWLERPPQGDTGGSEDESDDDDVDTWAPIDLGPVLAGEVTQPMPDLMLRHDGTALIYEGAINGVHGDSGSGKGWLVCHTIVRQAHRGYTSMLIDLEDVATSITARLQLLGMTDDEIVEHLIYIRPQTPPTPAEVARLVELIKARDVRLVVVDSLGEAFALEGIDENSDKEVGPWYRRVARPMAEAGAAVLVVDHSTKANDNPLHPSGSKRKRAAITGASYYAEAIDAFVKDRGGRLKLTCAKDRHGNYRKGEVSGYLAMEYTAGGELKLELWAPAVTETTVDLSSILAARAAVKAAKGEGQPLSIRALVGAMGIKVGTDTKRNGIELAIARGALAETAGPRNSRLVTFVSELPEVTDD
jgi:5S rRNA maturation endonuclease (ribonuclease M5)